MRKLRAIPAAVAALAMFAALLALTVKTGWADDASHSADDAAIRAAVQTFENGWNTHDAHLMVSILADDVEWTAWTGVYTHGRKGVEELHVDNFSKAYKNIHRTDTVKSIRYLGPDLASVDFDWTMTGAKRGDGSDWPYRAGYVNFLMARRDGRWQVIVSHTADFNAKAPAAVTSSANTH